MWSDALPNLLIGLREGLEAGLIVSIVLAAVVRSGRRAGLTAVWLGVACAAALSLAFGAVLTFAAADLSTTNQEVIGGVLSLVAVGFVTWMVFWMRRSARTLAVDLRERTETALVLGSRVLFVTAFVAVAREGLETALFLWSTTRTAGESTGPLIGAVIGLIAATLLCWALYRRAVRINLSRFFTWTGAALVVIAAGVVAYGLGELQGANLVGGSNTFAFDLTAHADPTSWYARLVEGVLNLTPKMTVLQIVGYVGYLVPVLGLFIVLVRRNNAATPDVAATRHAAASADVAPDVTPDAAPDVAPAELPERRRRRGRQAWVVAGAVVAVSGVGTAAAIAAFGPKASSGSPTIAVTNTACAPGWSTTDSGKRTFDVRNDSSGLVEIYLLNSDRRTARGELEGLAPGTTRTLTATLPPGGYVWKCITATGSESFSAEQRVSGAAIADAGAYVPATPTELLAAAATYRVQVAGMLQTLQTDTGALLAAVRQDPTSADARAAWLTAHLDYVRLGAAYGTFGDLDAAINGRSDGLVAGADDPGFTGFGRLEYELWQRPQGADPVATATRLDTDVASLRTEFSAAEIDPVDLPLRAHEILENGLQFELTGDSDHGSHSSLATLRAEVDATDVVLDALQPVLDSRDPALLANVRNALQAIGDETDRHRSVDGTWQPLDSLSRSDRQRLNGMVGHYLEVVAPVPDILELPSLAATPGSTPASTPASTSEAP